MKSKRIIWSKHDFTNSILYQARHNKLLTISQYPQKIILSQQWSNILIHMIKVSLLKQVEVSRHLKTDFRQQKLLISPLVYGSKNNVSYQIHIVSENSASIRLSQKHIGGIHTHLNQTCFSSFDLTNLLSRPLSLLSILVNPNEVYLAIRTKNTTLCNNSRENCEKDLIDLFQQNLTQLHKQNQLLPERTLFNLFIAHKFQLAFFQGRLQTKHPLILHQKKLMPKPPYIDYFKNSLISKIKNTL